MIGKLKKFTIKYKDKLIILLVVMGFIFYGILSNNDKEKVIASEISQIDKNINFNSQILVEIKGEVFRPGLYMLSEGARVNDLIIASGGVKSTANINELNFASRLSDGMVIYVRKIEESEEGSSKLISINNASLSELMELEGIGESKAKNIIKYREEKGLFQRTEDLTDVVGISTTIYNKIKERLSL